MEQKLPRWIDIGLLPVINILAAFIVAGVIIALIGENPFAALSVLVKGAASADLSAIVTGLSSALLSMVKV